MIFLFQKYPSQKQKSRIGFGFDSDDIYRFLGYHDLVEDDVQLVIKFTREFPYFPDKNEILNLYIVLMKEEGKLFLDALK